MAYDSTYSAYASIAGGGGYDSTYSAMKAAAVALGAEDKNYDSEYSIAVELATLAENGEIGGTPKLEVDLVETISENGQNVYTPAEGSVYKSVTIDVNVPTPTFETQTKELSIVNNGVVSVTPDQGYDGLSKVDVTVNVPIPTFETQIKELSIVNNGVVSVTPDLGYDGLSQVDITVNVPTSGGTNYSYKTNLADVNGLKVIGWDDESIGMYGDNVLGYEWQRSDYLVSQANKDLAEGFTEDKISSNKSNPDFVYCPMFDTSSITNMQSMFNQCSSLQSIPLLDTGSVMSMSSMFNSCSNLQSIPQLDTSSVMNMYYMFKDCSSLQSIPLLDTGSVTNMGSMFSSCSSLASIPQLDTSKVTDMDSMFKGCSSLQSIPLLDTGSVTNMKYMFQNCSNLKSIPQLDTSSVTSMYYMFNGCSSLQSIPQLDTSKVTDIGSMFGSCDSLTSIPLLDTGSITSISAPFSYTSSTDLTDLGGFKNLKVSWSSNFLDRVPNATVESLMNVINYAYDLTANGLSGQTLRFGTTNLNKLTEDQIAIATAKGWTLT